MDFFQTILIVNTFLCGVVAGFLFAFSVIVMPGIAKLSNLDFLKAFKLMDGIIQNNQPLFIIVWAGSAITSLILLVHSVLFFGGHFSIPIITITVAYLLGVQLPTVAVNIPLNNELQRLNLENLDTDALLQARERFEPRWNRFNRFRTLCAILVSLSLIIVCFIT